MKDRKLLNIELGRAKPSEYASLPPSGAVLVLDNIRSAHNVGSAFRTADAFRADKLYLCGICACPPSPEIHKSALGAENSVPWEHAEWSRPNMRCRFRTCGLIPTPPARSCSATRSTESCRKSSMLPISLWRYLSSAPSTP